ncbi:MAG: hypothetical protein WCT37_00845 [Patescibacteria group bacterium]|jgi:hypothetical protein
MKIIKQTPDLLILQENPIVGIFVGAIFLIVGVTILIKPPFLNSNDIPLWLPIVFILSGIIVILVLSKVTVVFDKSAAKVTITSKSLFKKVFQELSWQQIQAVELKEMNDKKGVSYGIFLLLTDGGVTPLQNSFDRRKGFAGQRLLYSKMKKIAQNLADFLVVQLVEKKSSGLYETMKGIYRDQFNKQRDNTP